MTLVGFGSSMRPLLQVAAVAASLHAVPCVAAGCEDLRAEIEERIRKTGVAEFTVSIADASASAPGKIVGTCDRGTRKLLYTQTRSSTAGAGAPGASGAAPGRPVKKVTPILTECKDGSVGMNADCKK